MILRPSAANANPLLILFSGIVLCVCLLVSQSALARQLVTYTVQNADPQQLEAVIRQYLSRDSSVSVYQNTIIVNGTAEELSKTRSLIEQLDVAGKQLLISVKTDSSGSQQQSDVQVSGSVRGGSHVETTTKTTVTVREFKGTSRGAGNQGVRATEGQPAFISYGASAPVNSYRSTPGGRIVSGQEYIDAQTGFYASAWVNGNQVRVRIDQRREQLQGRIIEGQQLQSEVSGQLGQWIPIGVIDSSRNNKSVGLSGYSGSKASGSEQIYLKVDLVN